MRCAREAPRGGETRRNPGARRLDASSLITPENPGHDYAPSFPGMGISFSKRAWRAQHLPDTEFAAEGEDTSTVNTKRLARFIKQGFLAPIWSREGEEDPENVSVLCRSRGRPVL